jgi:hypothetical protein
MSAAGDRTSRLSTTRAKVASLKRRRVDRDFARDGTPQLTFEEAVADHSASLSRRAYQTDSWFSRPQCDLCSRRMANMYDHIEDHESGRVNDDGDRTDPAGRRATNQRLAKRGHKRSK